MVDDACRSHIPMTIVAQQSWSANHIKTLGVLANKVPLSAFHTVKVTPAYALLPVLAS